MSRKNERIFILPWGFIGLRVTEDRPGGYETHPGGIFKNGMVPSPTRECSRYTSCCDGNGLESHRIAQQVRCRGSRDC